MRMNRRALGGTIVALILAALGAIYGVGKGGDAQGPGPSNSPSRTPSHAHSAFERKSARSRCVAPHSWHSYSNIGIVRLPPSAGGPWRACPHAIGFRTRETVTLVCDRTRRPEARGRKPEGGGPGTGNQNRERGTRGSNG